jgi:hypothetical protein
VLASAGLEARLFSFGRRDRSRPAKQQEKPDHPRAVFSFEVVKHVNDARAVGLSQAVNDVENGPLRAAKSQARDYDVQVAGSPAKGRWRLVPSR